MIVKAAHDLGFREDDTSSTKMRVVPERGNNDDENDFAEFLSSIEVIAFSSFSHILLLFDAVDRIEEEATQLMVDDKS